ncbi:MAG: hypothetical protein WEC59_08870 [Salibacteraceae bacterium]
MNTELIFQNITQIVELTPDEKALFISFLKPKSIKRKHVLLQWGEIAADTYFVNYRALRNYIDLS